MKKLKRKLDGPKVVYLILVCVALLEMVASILSAIYASDPGIRDAAFTNIFLACLAIILFSIPWGIETRFKIDIPNYLEVILLLFLFCAIVLGNIHNFLVTVRGYDKVLHTISGIIIAIIGYEIIHMWNEFKNEKTKISPGLLSLFAFTFSIALLVLWEFYEFGIDTISYLLDSNTDRNMQRYQWVNTITIYPQPYGLVDTMLDLILEAFGAAVVSFSGWRILLKKENKIRMNEGVIEW